MLYQCTKDMLKTLKVDQPVKLDIYNDLFAWNVRMINLEKKNLVHLMNNASKLSVIFYGITEFRAFDALAKAGIKSVLEELGLDEGIVRQYLDQASAGIFSNSGSRKQMGVLNWASMDAVYLFKDHSEEGLLQHTLCEKINKSIVKNDKGDYIIPGLVMKNMLLRTFGGQVVNYDLAKIADQMFNEEWLRPEVFLNVRDGSIWTAERASRGGREMDEDEDFVTIHQEYFDFFAYFNRFVVNVVNDRFYRELELLQQESNLQQRIKLLIKRYPDVNLQWNIYQQAAKEQLVKEWLETWGLR